MIEPYQHEPVEEDLGEEAMPVAKKTPCQKMKAMRTNRDLTTLIGKIL